MNIFFTRIIIFILISSDIFSKRLIFSYKSFFNGFSFIQTTINSWIAWSLPLNSTITIPLSIIFITVVIFLYYKKLLPQSFFILFIAWAIGNTYDRFVFDGVRDMFVFFDFFIFNLADIYLNLAIFAYIRGEVSHKSITTKKKGSY